MTNTAAAKREALRSKIAARSTDDLLVTLAQLNAMPETRESILIATIAHDVIATREGIEDLVWEVEADTYLEAILLALATRDAALASA